MKGELIKGRCEWVATILIDDPEVDGFEKVMVFEMFNGRFYAPTFGLEMESIDELAAEINRRYLKLDPSEERMPWDYGVALLG